MIEWGTDLSVLWRADGRSMFKEKVLAHFMDGIGMRTAPSKLSK